jgi:hypothetical protein
MVEQERNLLSEKLQSMVDRDLTLKMIQNNHNKLQK